ncbi:MAG: hypothetical protein LBU23_04225 [Planctomycetota bacterium]|nr:hypothetical protein [Planctomycetota bacterium]
MSKIEALSRLAAGEASPPPLNAAGIMGRVRGLEPEDPDNAVPLTFFAGGAALAAAAALAVSLLAATAWTELSDPLAAMNSLAGVMDIML